MEEMLQVQLCITTGSSGDWTSPASGSIGRDLGMNPPNYKTSRLHAGMDIAKYGKIDRSSDKGDGCRFTGKIIRSLGNDVITHVVDGKT